MSARTAITHAELKRLGWTRTDPRPWSKLSARWSHVDGWKLEHCGHPTANWPWLLIDPEGRKVLTGIIGPHRNPDFGTAWPDLAQPARWVASSKSTRERAS